VSGVLVKKVREKTATKTVSNELPVKAVVTSYYILSEN